MAKNYPAKKKAYKPWTPPVIVRKPRFLPKSGKWIPQFETVFDFVTNGKGHGAIKAVAGSGKTTVLVELGYRYTEAHPYHKVAAVAFSKSIQEELTARMAVGVKAITTHAAGFRSVIRVWGNGKANFELQGPKGFVVQNLAENAIGYEKEKEDDRDALCHAVSLCKTRLAHTVEEVIEVLDYWNIDSTYPKEEFAKHVLSIMDHMKKQPGVGVDKKMVITFDDQVWLPVVNEWTPAEQYDLVLVDEAQDLSPARTAIVKSLLKPGGRIIVVGDHKQAIFNFAGADIHALPNLIKELDAHEMPLTCSFRCAKNIVKEAQRYNPEITAAPDAPDGIVDIVSPKDMLKTIKAGDAVVSRTNAPLVKVFFKLARAGVRVRMLGRDFAASIGMRVKAWQKKAKKDKKKFTVDDLLNKNSEWLNDQIKYLKKKKMSTDRAVDEADTIASLCEDLSASTGAEASVKEVLERIDTIFSADEEPGGTDGTKCITLSSTHKFKGLERDHIYGLWDTYRPSDGEEEENLAYVLITRAKLHFSFVKGKFQD